MPPLVATTSNEDFLDCFFFDLTPSLDSFLALAFSLLALLFCVLLCFALGLGSTSSFSSGSTDSETTDNAFNLSSSFAIISFCLAARSCNSFKVSSFPPLFANLRR